MSIHINIVTPKTTYGICNFSQYNFVYPSITQPGDLNQLILCKNNVTVFVILMTCNVGDIRTYCRGIIIDPESIILLVYNFWILERTRT